jgi:GNAT superfamily N-acetyltransferase
VIRRLGERDIEAFITLRRETLADSPRAFSASPEGDPGQDPVFVRQMMSRPEIEVVFGAFRQGELVGTATVHRFERSKEAHEAVLWGMYVRPGARGRGLGAALLAAAIDHARTLDGVTDLHLSVADTAMAARRLYERAGFVCWGTELSALIVDGAAVDIDHMVLEAGCDLH